MKESQRIIPTAERVQMGTRKELGYQINPKEFLMWYVHSSAPKVNWDNWKQLDILRNEDVSIVDSVADDEVSAKKKIYTSAMDPRELFEFLDVTYDKDGMLISNVPEVIFLESPDVEKAQEMKVAIARVHDAVDNFLDEEGNFEAGLRNVEKSLLTPVIVFLSHDNKAKDFMRSGGADLVLDDLSGEGIKQLMDLTARMKASTSSLMTERLRQIKSEFYNSVEEKLDARSEITAETEKEIEILHEIFQRIGDVQKVLDIACGNGRIDIPLLEKGYEVTGVDANEKFLQGAIRKALEKNISGAQFKKGDVIDFSGVVDPGSQDAVIYTWHSILEAFGVGNLLHTFGNSWSALRPGGVLVFDQPTRENPHMEDGWYGNDPDGEHQYLSYIMEEDEIKFILKTAGFEDVKIQKWKTKPSGEYPDGMHKFTVSARKPLVND